MCRGHYGSVCYVLDPLALEELSPEVAEFLGEHAEALDLRMAVPSRWGVVLKTLEQANTQADADAIFAWRKSNGWRSERRKRTLEGADAGRRGRGGGSVGSPRTSGYDLLRSPGVLPILPAEAF
jgi:hypothetical protein